MGIKIENMAGHMLRTIERRIIMGSITWVRMAAKEIVGYKQLKKNNTTTLSEIKSYKKQFEDFIYSTIIRHMENNIEGRHSEQIGWLVQRRPKKKSQWRNITYEINVEKSQDDAIFREFLSEKDFRVEESRGLARLVPVFIDVPEN